MPSQSRSTPNLPTNQMSISSRLVFQQPTVIVARKDFPAEDLKEFFSLSRSANSRPAGARDISIAVLRRSLPSPMTGGSDLADNLKSAGATYSDEVGPKGRGQEFFCWGRARGVPHLLERRSRRPGDLAVRLGRALTNAQIGGPLWGANRKTLRRRTAS